MLASGSISVGATEWRISKATYVALVATLVVYPCFRMAVAYLNLFPAQHSSDAWWNMWSVVLIGHWACAAIVMAAIASEKGGMASVGLSIAAFVRHRFLFLMILFAAGLVACFSPNYFYGEVFPDRMQSHPFGPVTPSQRVFWIGMAVTAGFVEELVFRGYALTRLRAICGLPAAIAISLLAFALVHGPSAFDPKYLALYLISGGVFSLIFLLLKSRRLEVLIVLHAGIDLALVAAP